MGNKPIFSGGGTGKNEQKKEKNANVKGTGKKGG
jgi:hypothetical protein